MRRGNKKVNLEKRREIYNYKLSKIKFWLYLFERTKDRIPLKSKEIFEELGYNEDIDFSSKKRKLDRDLVEIDAIFNIEFKGELANDEYNYNIKLQEDNSDLGIKTIYNELKNIEESLTMLNQDRSSKNSNLKGYIQKHYEDYSDKLKKENFGKIQNAIIKSSCVEICYDDKYTRTKNIEIKMEPYILREYLYKWYVYGKVTEVNGEKIEPYTKVIGLDVITEDIEIGPDSSYNNIDNKNEIFDKTIGTTLTFNKKECKVKKVEFEVRKIIAHHVISQPIHSSQEVLRENDNSFVFKVNVRNNFELMISLMKYLPHIKVNKPQDVKDKFYCWLKESAEYKNSEFTPVSDCDKHN